MQQAQELFTQRTVPLLTLFATPALSAAAREKVVGWYSTGPKIREADLDINGLITRFSDWPPVLVICEVQVCWAVCLG